MKKALSLLVFIVISMIAKAQFMVYEPLYTPGTPSRSTPIVPRNYGPFSTYTPAETVVTGKTFNAVVYYESSTGHTNRYILPVVINNGSVDKIIFNNNGGCVHTGINNSGYKYYGGKLQYFEDIEMYGTVVTIVYSSTSWQKYTVMLQ